MNDLPYGPKVLTVADSAENCGDTLTLIPVTVERQNCFQKDDAV
jgi:hypothetical protein